MNFRRLILAILLVLVALVLTSQWWLGPLQHLIPSLANVNISIPALDSFSNGINGLFGQINIRFQK